MNWYQQEKTAASHAVDRIWQRFRPYVSQIMPAMRAAEEIYTDVPTAVVLFEIPIEEAKQRKPYHGDYSYDDWVVGVIRPNEGIGRTATIEGFRSPNHPEMPRQFTADRFRVDRVVTHDQFMQDWQNLKAQKQQMLTPEPIPA